MCEPASIIAATSAIVGYAAQSRQADAQEAYQNSVYEQTKENARAAFFTKAAQANLRLQQEQEAATEQQLQNNIDSAKAKSAAGVSAGEAGVTGLSVDALLANFDRTRAKQGQAIERNLSFITQQTAEDIKGYSAEARSRTIAALPQPVERPSFLGTALKVAGSAYEGYSKSQSNKPPAKRGA